MKPEELWLNLRKNRLLRRIYMLPGIHGLVKTFIEWLIPSGSRRLLTVRDGIGKGLRLALLLRWPVRMGSAGFWTVDRTACIGPRAGGIHWA